MKKVIYTLAVALLVAGGLVLANQGGKHETSKKAVLQPISAVDCETPLQKWEATPDGLNFKRWEASPQGQKVSAGVAKIRKHTNAVTDMDAVITSLSLPPGSRLGFGVMARIDGVDYIVKFDTEKSQLEQLRSLKVDDKIILKSRTVAVAPKYAYPILSAESVERDGKMIYKRIPPKGGC